MTVEQWLTAWFDYLQAVGARLIWRFLGSEFFKATVVLLVVLAVLGGFCGWIRSLGGRRR